MAKADKPRPAVTSEPLRRAWQLYEAGDVVRARQLAQQVLAQPGSEAEAAEARELVTRTAPPRAVFLYAAVALAVLLGLLLLASLRS